VKFKVGDKVVFGNRYSGVVTKVHRFTREYTIVMNSGRYKNVPYRASAKSVSRLMA
jgi:hypothetical protein